MADIRINALATTAASTASDDFIAVDGSANGTRKLNAYSPTFGGNLTLSGATSTITLGSSNTASIAVDSNGALTVTPKAGQAVNLGNTASSAAQLFSLADYAASISLKNSSVASADVRNWAIRTDDANFGDFNIKQSATRGGDAFSGVKRLVIDKDGNVSVPSGNLTVSGTAIGLGGSTVPAWSSHNVLQTSDLASFGSFTGNKNAQVMHNAFWNGSAYKYIETAAASYYAQTAGVHSWFTAASGTAGNTITFAEAARITSSGNFLIGTTTDGGQKLQVAGKGLIAPSANQENAFFVRNTATNGYSTIQFENTSGTGKGYIGYGNTFTGNALADQFYILSAGSLILNTNGSLTPTLTLDTSSNATFAGSIAIGNTVNTVSPTSPNRTITMVIGGTTYYIHAKTTND